MNVGMLGGGTVVNAIPREAWFTVDLRSLDSATQDRLEKAVVSTAQRSGEQEGVGFRMEQKMGLDYSKARPQQERLNHPLVQTALAVAQLLPQAWHPGNRTRSDVGSTDANIAVSMGIPAVAVGAADRKMPHRLEEICRSEQYRAGHQVADCASSSGDNALGYWRLAFSCWLATDGSDMSSWTLLATRRRTTNSR